MVANAPKPTNGDVAAATSVVHVAAMGDLHCTDKSRGVFQPLFTRVAESAQLAILCGDLTDHGLATEAKVLADEIHATLRIPVLAVMGNHDFESGQEDQVRHILEKAGVMFLDGDAREVCGIGFAGAKGFGGGFGRGTLGSFGEKVVKLFVQAAIDEAMKLEAALSRLRTNAKIAVLHYSPIQATVENEPVQIFPFLGCSRLEEPLNRFGVTAVVHGHAHNGAPEGKTTAGVPVYNVAVPLMRKLYPNNPPFRILEVAVQSKPTAPTPATPLDASMMTESPVHSPVG
jgi:Icc-related predicted phosphoesterase